MSDTNLRSLVSKYVAGQGNQVDLGSALPTILLGILDLVDGLSGQVGDLSNLETDHKSDIIQAINELFDVAETQHMVISMTQSNAERKVIYDECLKHIHLAKNIVLFNADDELYYRVNGYNFHEDVLWLNAIFSDTEDLRSVTICIASNGSISVV